MTLQSGARLGPYEIAALIGRGGMGEVYRATDLHLRRQVAVKVLPEAFAADRDRLARFAREAEILAQLNHPNIAQIYSLERSPQASALVMELVDGMTLSQRIEQGPIPVADALAIARQIAEGVEAAHLAGIIHRDLKPSNVKLRGDGVVKVLDFGLAKALDPAGSVEAAVASTTTMTRAGMTRAGAVVGTAPYMSPEQASGLAVDRSADIWAFGCVLFEMLSGRRAFGADEQVVVTAAVLRNDPDWSRLPREVPAAVRNLLRRCLEKDRRRRLADMRDARFAIEDAAGDPPGVPPMPAPSFRRERWAWGAALALALVASATLLWSGRGPVPAHPTELRVEISTPPTTDLASIALSPDGEKIVFVASSQGRPVLWLRSLVTAEARPLPETDGALFPFWSPDSRAIGFFANGRLYRIGVDGGSLTELGLAPVGAGGTWSGDGVIVYTRVPSATPLRMAETGGQPTSVGGFDRLKDRCSFPHFLPDGRRFLYYTADVQGRGVYSAGLDGSGRERLIPSDSAAVFLAPDRVAFVRAGTLLEQRLDMASLRPLGDPVPIDKGVVVDNLGVAAVSASSQGWIAYRTGAGNRRRRFVRLDRMGRQIGEALPPDAQLPQNLSLTADGRRLVLQRTVDGNFDLWVLDLERRALTRLTSSPHPEVMPVFSPRGDRVVFGGRGKGAFDLWQVGVAERPEPTLVYDGPLAELPLDWSRDGRFMLFQSNSEAGTTDIWALAMEGGPKPFPVAEGPGIETQGVFSPDGRWVAFESDETGRREVYLQPFPRPGTRLLVSTQGGGQPQWRPDGRELYYVASDGRLTAVALRLDARSGAAEAAAPTPLFSAALNTGRSPASRQEYVVAPDGTFLINRLVEEEGAPITLVLRRPL
jgi:serine/threonine protein kinase/Tol biopolymer transport system component